jgi:hypothetical protein
MEKEEVKATSKVEESCQQAAGEARELVSIFSIGLNEEMTRTLRANFGEREITLPSRTGHRWRLSATESDRAMVRPCGDSDANRNDAGLCRSS